MESSFWAPHIYKGSWDLPYHSSFPNLMACYILLLPTLNLINPGRLPLLSTVSSHSLSLCPWYKNPHTSLLQTATEKPTNPSEINCVRLPATNHLLYRFVPWTTTVRIYLPMYDNHCTFSFREHFALGAIKNWQILCYKWTFQLTRDEFPPKRIRNTKAAAAMDFPMYVVETNSSKGRNPANL